MRDLSPKTECVLAFGSESERGPFVGEVEKRDEKRFGTACDGNLFVLFAGMGLSEKSNFLS